MVNISEKKDYTRAHYRVTLLFLIASRAPPQLLIHSAHFDDRKHLPVNQLKIQWKDLSKCSLGGLQIYLPMDFLFLPEVAFPIAVRTRSLNYLILRSYERTTLQHYFSKRSYSWSIRSQLPRSPQSFLSPAPSSIQ